MPSRPCSVLTRRQLLWGRDDPHRACQLISQRWMRHRCVPRRYHRHMPPCHATPLMLADPSPQAWVEGAATSERWASPVAAVLVSLSRLLLASSPPHPAGSVNTKPCPAEESCEGSERVSQPLGIYHPGAAQTCSVRARHPSSGAGAAVVPTSAGYFPWEQQNHTPTKVLKGRDGHTPFFFIEAKPFPWRKRQAMRRTVT